MADLHQASLLTSGQGILEDLLETEEFQDGQIHTGMETEAALVRSQGGIELHTVTAVDLQLVLVILPDHAELNHALGDGGDLERSLVFWILLEQRRIFESGSKLCDGVSRPGKIRRSVGHGHLCKPARTRAQMGD